MNNMTCDVIIGVQIPNIEENHSSNWKRKCTKPANYLVRPKGVTDFSFLCCEKCSNFFMRSEYDFTRIK